MANSDYAGRRSCRRVRNRVNRSRTRSQSSPLVRAKGRPNLLAMRDGSRRANSDCRAEASHRTKRRSRPRRVLIPLAILTELVGSNLLDGVRESRRRLVNHSRQHCAADRPTTRHLPPRSYDGRRVPRKLRRPRPSPPSSDPRSSNRRRSCVFRSRSGRRPAGQHRVVTVE